MANFNQIKDSINHFTTVKSRKKLYIVLGVLTALILLISIYFMLAPINFNSAGFKVLLVVLAGIWCIPLLTRKKTVVNGTETFKRNKILSPHGIPFFIAIGLAAFFIVLSIGVSPLFLSSKYRELINVTESNNFSTEVENYDRMLIPIVDEALAKKLGDKRLGDENYGSQFQVGTYTMISYGGALYWVAPIEYRGFFQWTNKTTSPGYLKINALKDDDVEIVKKPLNYVESAFFWDDLNRKNYFSNMTAYRQGKPHLELDDNGNPMFVDSVLTNRFVFTSGLDTVGVIITDPDTGKAVYYDKDEVPEWVDRIHPSEIIYNQLNDWGKYVNGYFNTWFAKRDMITVSSGSNYLYNNGRMYLYTGMTSIGGDESVVGISLTDVRTKQSTFYKVGGATESAAAKAAEGVEQAQRFYASDPVLINVNGIPTYFMTLKNNEGLIERYAYVSVKDYSIAEVDKDKGTALSNYISAVSPDEMPRNVSLTIKEITSTTINSNSTYLIKFNNPFVAGNEEYDANFENFVFEAPITLSNELAFLKSGDMVKVDYVELKGDDGRDRFIIKKIMRDTI